MATFVNTIDKMSAEDAEDAILTGELTELSENRTTNHNFDARYMPGLESANLPMCEWAGGMEYASSLKTVKFFSALVVNAYGFQYCTSLVRIHFPKAKEVRNNAFTGATAFEALILSNNVEVASLQSVNTFKNTHIENGTGYIYVRKRFLEQYKAATNWSAHAAQIVAIEDYPEIQAIVDADLAEMRGGTA